MKNLSIGKKTSLAILSSYAALAVIGIVIYLNLLTFIRTQRWVAHPHQVMQNMSGQARGTPPLGTRKLLERAPSHGVQLD